MVEVLSQKEIDTLLTALSTGEMDAEKLKQEESVKKIRVYDFKRAVRFSKDHIRSLTRIHENFARYLTTYFSAQLRTFVQMNVVQVEQLPYDEFIRSIPEMTILNIFEASPLEGRMVMEVPLNVAAAMLDRMLGGNGAESDAVDLNSLTEIDAVILERIFRKALESLKESWKSILDISPKYEGLETNPQFMQIVSPNETIALITLSTSIGNTTGVIHLCIPHVVIEPIMPKLSVHHWFISQKKEKSIQEDQSLREQLHKTTLSIIAELGTSRITVKEFLNLDKGDVLVLDRAAEAGLPIKIGDKIKFLGSPGQIKNKLAIQISEVIEEDEYDQ